MSVIQETTQRRLSNIGAGALFLVIGVVGYLIMVASSSRAEARADEMLRKRQ